MDRKTIFWNMKSYASIIRVLVGVRFNYEIRNYWDLRYCKCSYISNARNIYCQIKYLSNLQFVGNLLKPITPFKSIYLTGSFYEKCENRKPWSDYVQITDKHININCTKVK